MYILIVEDEPLVALALERLLSTKGFEVRHASNGEIALSLFRAKPADIVITYLNMPIMDGYELIEHLVELSLHIPIAVVASAVPNEVERRLFALGARVFLPKPVDPDDLISAIRSLM